jgi:hypothetical protein
MKRPILACLAVFASLAVTQQSYAQSTLPVGDGRVSRTPTVGYVMACNQSFRTGSTRHVGDWFHGDT